VRAVLILLVASLVAGCALGGAEGGVASYDALKKAKDDCTAKGGVFVLKSGDPTWIGNYACERK
jgi:hypothetical protein